MAAKDRPQGGSQPQEPSEGGGVAVAEEQQPGSGDRANALAANPSTEQVTQAGGDLEAQAEGQRIRDDVRAEQEDREVITLAAAMTTGDKNAVQYDDTGRLVNADGKPIALAADATDPDVGWTVQHANRDDNPVAYPGGPSTTPDQTVHPDELPDPVAALQAGLLPQNAGVLNIDPQKFEGKKSLEA